MNRINFNPIKWVSDIFIIHEKTLAQMQIDNNKAANERMKSVIDGIGSDRQPFPWAKQNKDGKWRHWRKSK